MISCLARFVREQIEKSVNILSEPDDMFDVRYEQGRISGLKTVLNWLDKNGHYAEDDE